LEYFEYDSAHIKKNKKVEISISKSIQKLLLHRNLMANA
jgi:hypothetical protein